MPTLILLDSSLSMLNPLQSESEAEEEGVSSLSRKDLAVKGVSQFIHLLQETNKHEFVSLSVSEISVLQATFSDSVNVLQPFTRDFASIIVSCNSLELESKTLPGPALRYAGDECSTTWSCGSYCQIIMITDGLGMDFESGDVEILPFKFLSFLHIVCLNKKSECDPGFCQDLTSLIKKNNQRDGVHFMEEVSVIGVKRIFSEIVEKHYAPSFAVLKCGSFSIPVQLTPPPRTMETEQDFETRKWTVGNTIEIVGFLKPAELAYPPVCTRHLVLPLTNPSVSEENQTSVFKDGEKSPNFCVLLHGSMIVSQMVAVCELIPGWYAVLYLLPDSKKSNLILNTFAPGASNVSWLGKLDQLTIRPFLFAETRSPFPVPQKPKPSYSVVSPGWLESSSVQSDVQKLLRQARKIPDRQQQFYQELNRITRHSMAVGFPTLMKKVASLLEREASTPSANQQMKKQLLHVSSILRTKQLRYDDSIKPAK